MKTLAKLFIFSLKPTKFIEKSRAGAQMLCASFSPGGIFMATGNTDHVVRIYRYNESKFAKIAELPSHTVSFLANKYDASITMKVIAFVVSHRIVSTAFNTHIALSASHPAVLTEPLACGDSCDRTGVQSSCAAFLKRNSLSQSLKLHLDLILTDVIIYFACPPQPLPRRPSEERSSQSVDVVLVTRRRVRHHCGDRPDHPSVELVHGRTCAQVEGAQR